MSNDISKSVSQRGRGEEIAENRRIYEVSDELLRRSQLYEAQLRDGQEHVSRKILRVACCPLCILLFLSLTISWFMSKNLIEV